MKLSSAELVVELDPLHGAEILELTDRRTGVGLLGHPPFTALKPVGGDLDEEAWTERYRGGWQVLAPNAGNACRVGDVQHGFHGRASVDRWEVVNQSHDSAVLRWRGQGLELTRGVSVDGDTVTVELGWTASSEPAPLIAVEHIVLGESMLSPGCIITADAAAQELSETDGPVVPSSNPSRWPDVLGPGGVVHGNAERSLAEPRSTFLALTAWKLGTAMLTNLSLGVTLDLRWDVTKLGCAWVWEEVRASGGIWDRRTELMGFELASVPHSLGLATAVDAGQAWWAQPGQQDQYQLALRVRSVRE